MKLQGKVAVITGGSGTLGQAFAKGLCQEGAIVYILNRDISTSQTVVDSFRKEGFNIHAIACDVLDENAVTLAADTIVEQNGKVDILVNCAGGNFSGATVKPEQSIFDLSIAHFRQVTDLNLTGTVIPSKAFCKSMVAQGSGCIINISSMAAALPLTRVAGYSASKAAIDNFTRWLMVELTSKYGEGIRVNAIAPGFFIAKQNKALLLNEDGSYTARGKTVISQTPQKRFGEPDELISTLIWLCDDASSFVNGVVVPVDGGFSAFSGV